MSLLSKQMYSPSASRTARLLKRRKIESESSRSIRKRSDGSLRNSRNVASSVLPLSTINTS